MKKDVLHFGLKTGRASFCNGFTLMEVLIVVVLLGLTATIVVPRFMDFSDETEASVMAHNFKYAYNAFQYYRAIQGAYPRDVSRGQIPAGMSTLLEGMNWTRETPAGGYWDWDYNVFEITASVSVRGSSWTSSQWQKVDEILDDGNLATGAFRKVSDGVMYVIQN